MVVIKDKGFQLSQDSVTYLGVNFRKTQGVVFWDHTDENKEIWRQLLQWPQPTTGRGIASRIGTLNWHLFVAGERWSRWRDLWEVANGFLGPCYNGSRDWDEVWVNSNELIALTIAALKQICDQQPLARTLRLHQQEGTLIASDASDVGGGCVLFDERGISDFIQWVWTEAEKRLHINRKELLAAIRGIMRWGAESTFVFIDNTAAESWLKDPEELMRHEVDRGRFIYIESMRVSSTENPADGVSRGHLPSREDEDLARKLHLSWRNRPVPWYAEPRPFDIVAERRQQKKAERQQKRKRCRSPSLA